MAIPGSSDGQEVIRRGGIHAQSSSGTSFKFDGTSPSTGTSSYVVPDHHIITMLTMIFCDQSNGAEEINLEMDGAGNSGFIMFKQALAAFATYVWEDKFTMITGDKLTLSTVASTNIDCYYTYLDQDWS